MTERDDNGLAWYGTPQLPKAGGFVDGVGLNEKPKGLALDPEATAPERVTRRGAGRSANLSVERLDDRGSEPVQRNGRVRMKPT